MRLNNICRGGQTLRIAFGISTLSMLLLVVGAVAVPIEEWNKTFGGTGEDGTYSARQTSDGGYILAGYAEPGNGARLAWLIKTDANGNQQWNRTFGSGEDYEYALSVKQTRDGGYVLAGRKWSYGSGDDFWLIKTDTNGSQQWNRSFGGQGEDRANSLQQTSDNGYILAGFTESIMTGYDFWLVKTDTNGIEQWNRSFGGECFDKAHSVQQTSDGGYILAGGTCSYGAGTYEGWGADNAWLIKTDANGIEQWNRTFGSTGSNEASSVQQTSDGGYILVGGWTDSVEPNGDAWLIKTDANGNQQWSKTFGGTGEQFATSVQKTSDGGYALAGYTYFGLSGEDAWLIKTDANGNQQWGKTFGIDRYFDDIFSVQQTSDGGYILAGKTNAYGAGGYDDAWLIKVSGDSSIIPAPTSSGGNVVLIYAGSDGIVSRSEAVQAVRDYFSGIVTKQEAIGVVMAYFGG